MGERAKPLAGGFQFIKKAVAERGAACGDERGDGLSEIAPRGGAP